MSSTVMSERIFKYPPMERQDLNQSQLGSFKFTPVDPIDPASNLQSLTQSARQYLDQKMYGGLHRGSSSTAGAVSDDASTFSPRPPFPQTHASNADAEFFNKHIKPDLGDSRLRLGPAAFRSAVDGIGSPQKNRGAIHVRQDTESTGGFHDPNDSFSARQAVSSQMSGVAMDPMAVDYLPPTELVNPSRPESSSFNETLCVALTNEQRSHSATKDLLLQQLTRCAQLEEQLKKNQTQIASLNTTINNLGAIIKHNASKQNSEDKRSQKSIDWSESTEEAALKEFYRDYQKLKDQTKERAEAKARQERMHQVENLSTRNGDLSSSDGAQTAANGGMDDDLQLYNLDFLQKPDMGDIQDSVLRQTLRKHFSIENFANIGKTPVTPSKRRPGLNRLIDITPEESVTGAKDNDITQEPAGSIVVRHSPADDKSIVQNEVSMLPNNQLLPGNSQGGQGLRVISNLHRNLSQDYLATSNGPVDQAVANFSSQDGVKQVLGLRANSTAVDLTMEHLDKLKALRIAELDRETTPPRDKNYGRLSPESSTDEEDEQPSPAIVAAEGTQLMHRITVQIGTNLDGETKWKIHKDNPIFEDEAEKWEILHRMGPLFFNNSPFGTHPVRFLPEDAALSVDAFRTVMIDGIPVGSTMMDVLDIVKGGSLESIQLFAPIGTATTSMTARVVFIHERAAHNMIRHQQSTGGVDSTATQFKIGEVSVRCWMPTDATYPRNANVERAISEQSASRIILVPGVDDYVYNMLPYEIPAPYDRHIIDFGYMPDGAATIEFSDIKTAIKVKEILGRSADLMNAELQYGRDYTCEPYV